MKNNNLYDQNSPFEIRSEINHSSNVYITNIDNTSDRNRIETALSISIIDKNRTCSLYNNSFDVYQFYIITKSNKFLSNQTAEKKIRVQNTEILVKYFINDLKKIHCIAELMKNNFDKLNFFFQSKEKNY